MKPMAIHLIITRIKPLPLQEQIDYLRAALKLEKRFSVRRNEIESLLCGKLTKQLLRESRVA